MNKILFFDEFIEATARNKLEMASTALRRPTLGKSRLVMRALKKLNKQRKKAGLKKIKHKNLKLVTPKGWKKA